MMDQLYNLMLPRKTALATYLKNNYGNFLKKMTDEDWMTEADDLLWALRAQPNPEPLRSDEYMPVRDLGRGKGSL